jgi:glycerophosphoryl diester phosphodiesterase
MARRAPTMVSAHRRLTRAQVEAALALDVDYVEFDVQRCADGALILHHDPTIVLDAGDEVRISRITQAQARALLPGMLTYDEALAMLAGRRHAHIDLKASATSPDTAIPAIARAVDVLGADGFVVTTSSDDTVRAIRDWGDAHGHTLLVGISLGRNTRGFSLLEQVRIRWSELRPRHRVHRAGASVVVAHHSLALLGVARFARRHGLPLLVWTVDTPRSLGFWMRRGRAWLVTTNEPTLALRARRTARLPS